MSKRAEQEAKEIHYLALIEANRIAREQWDKGYKQAEKDLALTWQDMKLIHEISEDFWEPKWCDDKDKEKAGYEKVLRRFNKQRNK